MKNRCQFVAWVIRGEIYYSGDAGKERINFQLCSPRPNKQGVWGKIYCTAFGQDAKILHDKVQSGTALWVDTEMSFYTNKKDELSSNFLIKDFQVLYNGKKTENAGSENQGTKPATPENTAVGNENLDGYEAMMDFMMN